MGLVGASGGPVILVVDDSDLGRHVAGNILRRRFHVEEATNGREALEQAIRLGPALIVMDLVMPVMDGFVATRCLRAHIETWRTPILAVTGLNTVEEHQRAIDAGCDLVLTRPFRPDTLLDAVDGLLSGRLVRFGARFVVAARH
ncbi:MAG: response regulator [Myxococcota bacterium]